ncbi:MAG: SGNH/GDSL hydrolase family protein [Propionibacteriaceae bacterium]|nr:SGNH/GDSL hydrolase family protein [Propionibacteriaceae bacterium]
MVFGDGSGNDSDEWVSVWAKDHLAKNRIASYRTWNRSTSEFSKAKRFGQGDDAISVWNASMASPNMGTEPERIARAWQPSEVVMINYGHRGSASQIKGQLNDILEEIRAHDPNVAVLVLIQNPDPVSSESVQRETTLAVQRWADTKGLPTINVYDAFIAHPAPRSQLVESDGSPTPLGSELFAKTVADALAKA